MSGCPHNADEMCGFCRSCAAFKWAIYTAGEELSPKEAIIGAVAAIVTVAHEQGMTGPVAATMQRAVNEMQKPSVETKH